MGLFKHLTESRVEEAGCLGVNQWNGSLWRQALEREVEGGEGARGGGSLPAKGTGQSPSKPMFAEPLQLGLADSSQP